MTLCLLAGLPAWAVRPDDKARPGKPAAGQAKAAPAREPSAEQLQVAREAQPFGVQVEWHGRLGTPLSVRGPDLGRRQPYSGGKGRQLKGGGAHAEDALAVLDNLARFYRLGDAAKEFAPKRVEPDTLGFHHVRLTQVYQGLRVFGGDLTVHFHKDGRAYQVTGQYVPDIQVEVAPPIEGDEAVRLAQRDLIARGYPEGQLAQGPALVIFARDTAPQLAYELALELSDPQSGPARWRYWIDARQGRVLLAYDDIQKIGPPTANGTNAVLTGSILAGEGGGTVSVTGWYENTGYFYLYNTNRHWHVYNVALSGFADNNTYAYRVTGAWGASDRAEMSLGRNFDLVQQYYREVHGRNSFDDTGVNARANAHDGVNYANAAWDPAKQQFFFGDGDGVEANALAVLDICGHEFTHAVTEHSAALVYSHESGALNESFSDIFGACVEFYAQPDGRAGYPNRSSSTADWFIGEDCWLSSTALRDLRNPWNTNTVGVGNEQPSRYQGTYWYTGPGDNGGVHHNSGVQNFFFYLLSEGGSGNNDGITYSVTGIGVTNAQQVAYRALTVYCGPNTDYQAVPNASLSAALDLNPAWAASVGAAWSAAGIGPFSVIPAGDLNCRGPVGGPFNPSAQTYRLFNRGALPMNWGVTHTQPWLNVTPVGGSLGAGESALVSVALEATAVGGLAAGIYTDRLSFSNSVDAAIPAREVRLLVQQPDYFTEVFDANDNDLDFQTLTFTPDGTTSFYSLCREPATNFPTDPMGGTRVPLGDDGYAQVTLAGANTVAIYQRRTNVFFIGSNGYLTMDFGDTTYKESIAGHFNLPRVSACFDDLDPASGGTVSWKQTDELVAVTFANVREYGSGATVNFQIELFYDGRIRLTYLGMGITDGLAGLSAGAGVPAGFVESDLGSYSSCWSPGRLVVIPEDVFASQGYPGGPFAPPARDYTLTNAGSTPLSWVAAATQPWITVDPSGGSLEPGATGNLSLRINANAGGLGQGTHTASVIFSNELTGATQTRGVQLAIAPLPALSISDAMVEEGDAGLTPLIFPVSLLPPSAQTVTVAYATGGGTALAGVDYLATNGVLQFQPGQTNQVITVWIIGDTNAERDDVFFVGLGNPTNALLGGWSYVPGTILDDDVEVKSEPILIWDDGPAQPYPAALAISGMTGPVTNVTVSLYGLSHTWPADIAILLVGPSGQSVVLMNGAGEYYDLDAITLTFDDAAPARLPQYERIDEGRYQPTNYRENIAFYPPAPAGPSGSRLSVFNGTNPKGTWSLYVMDTAEDESGQIAGGWSLTVNGVSASLAAVAIQPPTQVAAPGANALFQAVVSGRSNGLQWRHNGLDLPGATNSDLFLNDVSYDQTGFYTVGVNDGSQWLFSPPASLLVTLSHPLDLWNPRTPIDQRMVYYGVTYGAGYFVAVGSGILTSADGITWNSNRLASNSWFFTSVAFGNGRFVAVVDRGPILTSPDGLAWTAHTVGSSLTFHHVAYGNGQFVAVGNAIYTSPDGASWSNRLWSTYPSLLGVSYGNGLFVAVGYRGAILTSPDGRAWSSNCVSGTSQDLWDVACGNGRFVAVGAGGTILHSLDGQTWSTAVSGVTSGLNGVAYGNGLFVVVGMFGTVLSSPDGVKWTSHNARSSVPLFGVANGNDSFVAVGNSSIILQSDRLVPVPPRILQQPQDLILNQGSNFTSSILADGSPLLRYQWCLNGTNLADATNETFVCTNAPVSASGEYSVVVANPVGSVTSAVAHVWIGVPAGIAVHPLGQEVVQGGDVTFSAVATGTPPFGFRWRRLGTTIGFVELDQSVCFFTVSNLQASATFSVVVTNAARGVTSRSATVTVLADTDHDGLPDVWEQSHGLSSTDPQDAALDADGDGQSNLAEYRAGTDAQDALSSLKLELRLAGGAWLNFLAVSNRTYTVQYADSLDEECWSPLAHVVAYPTNRLESIIDPVPGRQRFYRLVTPRQP